MPLAAVVAAALTDYSARSKTLTVGGLDVVLAPVAVSGARYGTPIDSIVLTERGPGGVSELTFVIEDPSGAVTLERGQMIRFHDCILDEPLFLGFVASWAPRPWAPSGRSIAVRAVGVEVILDWAKVDDLTIPAGTLGYTAVQMAVAGVRGGLAAPLRAFCIPLGFSTGELAAPIGTLYGGTIDAISPLVIPAGTSLREAIRAILDDLTWSISDNATHVLCTVDFRLGLRVWPGISFDGLNLKEPSDWDTFSVADTVASTMAAANLDYTQDAIGSPVAVYIEGAGVSGVVTDGSLEAGEVAYFADLSIDTASRLQSAGIAYLARYRQQARGSFDLEAPTPSATIHPGTWFVLTDARLGLSIVAFWMQERTRRFYGAKEDWHVTFGGASPSLVSLIRRLTRSTLG